MAGSGPVWEGALRQAGVVRANSFEEVLDYLYAFHFQPLPRGKRVAIISGPGGTAVGTTDVCLKLGMEVPRFSERTTKRLRETMPLVGGSIGNPVDLSLASLVAPRVCKDAISIVAEDEGVDMLLVVAVVGGEQLRDMVAEAISGMKKRKPIVVTVMAGTMDSVARDFPLLLGSGISAYSDAVRAAKALARLYEYAQFWARRGIL
jgi:acyl-CoA synthetase (NDP forming)